MIKKLWCIAILLILITTCKDNNIKHTYYEDGNLRTQETFNPIDSTYSYLKYYSTGELYQTGTVSSNFKRIDYWKYFNKDGSVIAEGEYINNQKNGLWIYEDNRIKWDIYVYNNMSINYPSNWNIFEQENQVIAFIDNDSISLEPDRFTIDSFVDNEDLNNIYIENLDYLKQSIEKLEVIEETEVTINNVYGRLAKLFINQSGGLYINQLFIKSDSVVYSFNYFSNEESREIINEIMYSIIIN